MQLTVAPRGVAARVGPLVPAAWYAVAAVAYHLWSRVALRLDWLRFDPITIHGFPRRSFFSAYARWDSAWYLRIADTGYFYAGPGQQSAVAFFPAYPAAVRAAEVVTGDLMVAGLAVSLLSAAAAAVLFVVWASDRLSPRTAVLGLVLLAAFPYSYYLYGVVYADAFFIAAALAAFVLLERRHPWLSALAGALAAAARPIGLALVAGLVVRNLELDRVLVSRVGAAGRRRLVPALELGRLRLSTLAPGLSITGFLAFCALLWARFDDPLAFQHTGSADGWYRGLDLRTASKVLWFQLMADGEPTAGTLTLAVSGLLTVGALALLPAVYRRLGWGYCVYTAIAVLLPALTAPQFLGMGRYLLSAFPLFAVAAAGLERRARALPAAVALSGAMLLVFSTLFVRGYYLS